MNAAPPYQRNSATSREAAVAAVPAVATQVERIWSYVALNGPCTRQAISAGLDLAEKTVTPRVHSLMRAGGYKTTKGVVLQLAPAGYGTTASGRRAETLVAVQAGAQQASLAL